VRSTNTAYKHDGHDLEASATKTHRGWRPELTIDGQSYSFAAMGCFQIKLFHDQEEALIYADACGEWLINNRLN